MRLSLARWIALILFGLDFGYETQAISVVIYPPQFKRVAAPVCAAISGYRRIRSDGSGLTSGYNGGLGMV
jgi:hypothetical protein